MPKISVEGSFQIRALYQIFNVRGKNLLQMFLQYSKVQIYVHTTKPINGEPVFNHHKLNKGHPRKFSAHDKCCMKQTIPKFRKYVGNFTSRCWQFTIWHMSHIKQDIPKAFELLWLQVFTITKKGAHGLNSWKSILSMSPNLLSFSFAA